MTNRSRDEYMWGTDGIPSLPQPHDAEGVNQIDMEGFIFTPYGLRPDISAIDREELLRSGYGPISLSGEEFDG